jgi:hypothetical protein
MESTRREQLIKKRLLAKSSLTRMQNFIETGDHNVNEIQVRFKLPDILSKYETAQDELECSDEIDHSEDMALFEAQYFEVEAKFHEFLHKTLLLSTVATLHVQRTPAVPRLIANH